MSDLYRYQHIERARLLLHQKRFKDAETQASIVLQQNPEDAEAWQVIGHCRLDTKKYDEALHIFRQCLGIEPDNDYLHYLIAFTYYNKHDLVSSLRYVEQAISLFPYNAGYFSLLSNIYFSQRSYVKALEAANKGLNINAEDIACLNARSTALFRLNKKDEAYDTINEALQINPEDAYTHTNYGWHYLEKGKQKQALEHFREALRIYPNNNAAKEGYKSALKSKLPFYRWILQYSLWMHHQSRGVRIAMIFGLWLLVRSIAEFSESSTLWIRYTAGTLVLLYLLFVIFSWLGNSLGNLFLLVTPYGKPVLTESEKMAAKAVGISLLSGITLVVVSAFTNENFLYAGMIICSLAIPVSFTDFPLKLFKGTGRQITAHIILFLGIITVISLFINELTGLFFCLLYIFVFLGYMWTGSFKNL